MRIATKFLLSSGAVIISVGLLFGGSLVLIERFEREVRDNRERVGEAVDLSWQVKLTLQNQVVSLRDFILSGQSPADMKTYQNQKSEFLILLDELEALIPEAEEIDLLRRRHQNLMNLADQLADDSGFDARSRQDLQAVTSFRDDINFVVDDLIDRVRELNRESQENLIAFDRQVKTFQIILMVIVCGIIVVQFRFIFMPVIRAIETLHLGVTRFGDGQLDSRVKIRSKDEIEALGNSFNAMADRLETAYRTLEQKVEERTAELKAANQNLEVAMNDLQVAQMNLVQSEKMSGLGQLVAGVAHEINNPVNFIYGNLVHAQNYVDDFLELIHTFQEEYPQANPTIEAALEEADLEFAEEDVQKLMKSMRVGAERIREIVKSLRTFSRLDEAEQKEVDIHEGIDSTLMILKNNLKAKGDNPGIQVICDYGELPLVNCYAGQLNQVFMNLLVNAIDVLEERHRKTGELGKIKIETRAVENRAVRIAIADNGPGIPDNIKAKLFEPFFTTKPIGKGTGLGLAISYQIVVDKHGGKFWCDSTPGEGTEFVVEIPTRLDRR